MVLRQECTLTRNYDDDVENCKIMQWAALLGAISTTFLDNNNNNNNNNQGKKLSFQFTCPLGQVQCVFCLSEPQNYLSKNRQPQQY